MPGREPGARVLLALVWSRYAGVVTFVTAAAALLGLLAGVAWALALIAGALGIAVVYHARHVAALLRWLGNPTLDTVPGGKGIWDDIYAGLYRLLRRQRQSTSQLSATLEDFRRAGAAMPDGLVILDARDHIEWCNPRAEQHFGLQLARDEGQSITYMVRQPRFAEYLSRAQYDEPLLLRQARTGDRVLAVQLVPYGNREKLLLSRDVTDLERVETMRRDFVANVSHELRTPLTVLCGFLETLSDAPPAEREGLLTRSVPLMLGQAQRMERLVSDLLTLSRLESGHNPVRHDEVDVPAVIRAIHHEAQALSGGRHHVVLEAMHDGKLRGAEDELRSAFGNLVSNAIRYTPAGGEVRLSWKADVTDGNGGAVFAVRDTGIGIAPQHVPRLTERFYRVDRGRSRETGGTGLGLAIVKHVVNRHAARLEVTSEPGQGSCFSVIFPETRVDTKHGIVPENAVRSA